MQQQTIQFDGAQIQQRVDVRAMFANAVNSVNNYLNQRSEVYSRLCDFSVTRRTVLYMHLGTICLGVSVFAVWKSHTNLTHPVKVF